MFERKPHPYQDMSQDELLKDVRKGNRPSLIEEKKVGSANQLTNLGRFAALAYLGYVSVLSQPTGDFSTNLLRAAEAAVILASGVENKKVKMLAAGANVIGLMSGLEFMGPNTAPFLGAMIAINVIDILFS